MSELFLLQTYYMNIHGYPTGFENVAVFSTEQELEEHTQSHPVSDYLLHYKTSTIKWYS